MFLILKALLENWVGEELLTICTAGFTLFHLYLESVIRPREYFFAVIMKLIVEEKGGWNDRLMALVLMLGLEQKLCLWLQSDYCTSKIICPLLVPHYKGDEIILKNLCPLLKVYYVPLFLYTLLHLAYSMSLKLGRTGSSSNGVLLELYTRHISCIERSCKFLSKLSTTLVQRSSVYCTLPVSFVLFYEHFLLR